MSNVTARPSMTPPSSATKNNAPPAQAGRAPGAGSGDNGQDGRGSSRRPSDSLPAATFIQWLRDMYLIREFENRTGQAYQQAKIGGFCHLYIGQEAAAVGTINAVNADDPVITAYRDHGHALARGMDPGACMAEMYGKATGCAKGKGG